MDSHIFLPNGVHSALPGGGGADGTAGAPAVPLPGGSVPAVILTSAGSLALGCSASDYPSGGAAGALVIVSRGTCSFVTKATLAKAAGAVAIGVVNNTTGFFNPAIPGVTIPFIELRQTDSATFAGAPQPDNATVAGYSARRLGNGLVQPVGATQTSVIAHAEDGTPSLSFGVAELTRDFSGQASIVVENRGDAPASFALSVMQGAGAAHTATLSSSSITIGGHASRTVAVHLAVPVGTVGDLRALRQVQGGGLFLSPHRHHSLP